ncbi:hypothetical protein BOTBODRAFT_174024 [Botryobasidium botryosum FD-172 SS1]|uniref:Uncharacterized protein n=1 Tax=Botryobasidium botryosum (strain FD-172 SS1) TaxID=930990 RepID=A0A067MKB9_BOTB1|nr:hypothetical protein BOTBODRAFT_174024 [Botryobasidium botryosum FD-172 SS1]
MDFLMDKYVIQKTNMHSAHPLRPLLEDALDRPLQGNLVIQQVTAAILDLPSEASPHLGEDFTTQMHLRVPPWESPFHLDSSITKITFDPDHPYRPFHDFLRSCKESRVAPLVAELTPSSGPDADDTWGILRLGVLVKQSFAVKPLACLKIHGHLASRPVIAAGALHLLLNDTNFELHRFPSYGLLVSNRLLANCICVHPSRRILPSPPRAYAYLEQRASAKSLFVTAVQQPARRLRPLKAFRRLDPLDPLVFPYRHQAPTLAPTLTWRNTDVRGRALLATSLYANDIPLDHSASLFGASLNVVWINMRPRQLQVPIPLHLPGTHFTYAARVFSGHCPSPYYYGKMGLFGYSASCPCGFPIGSSAHIALACPLRSLWAGPSSRTSTIGSHASSAPASLPGGGSQTGYWGLQVRLPHGFKWIKIPHNHHTIDLRTAIAIHACAFEEYTPTDLVDNLRAEGLYDVSLADAYYDYYRLRAAFRHERDPSVRAIIDRYLTNATSHRDFGPAARGYMGPPGAPAAPSTTPLPSAAKPKKPTFAEAAKSASASTPGSNPPKFNPSPKVASPMRSKAKDPLSAAFKPLTPIAPEAQASGIVVVKHINRLLAPSHFQLKGCAWSPFGNFITTPHFSEDVAKLPEVLPRILLDMFKVEFRHLTFDNSSFVVVYNLPLGPPSNWADPSTIALALMAQNNILKPLPASPGRWLANPDRHKGTTASLRLSLSPLMKAAILRSGMLFFDGRPHPVHAFTAAKTKPNQCRQCWRLGHSEVWCRQTNPVCGTCAQGHPSHHHHAVAPNAAQLCVLCKGAHPSWTRWCVNRHIQLAAQPPLPKKKPAKPSAASKRHASKVTAGSSTKVPSSTTEPSGDVVTHL